MRVALMTKRTLERYLERNLKDRNGNENLDINNLKSRMKRLGYDLNKSCSDYDGLEAVVYKEITSMMIERNLLERQQGGSLTIEECYPLVRDCVSFHGKVLDENDIEEEDIVQNIMIKVYNNWNKFRGESRITTWIYRITKNEVINMLIYQNRHKRKAAGTISIEQDDFEKEDGQGSLEDMLVYDELLGMFVEYVEKLDVELEKEILEMFLSGFDNKTIAKTWNVRVAFVKEVLAKHQRIIEDMIGGE